MTDQHDTASDTVSADAGALVDEPLPGDGPAADATNGTEENGGKQAREWLTQLQTMIDDVATQAAPIARQVASKAAELAAIAAEKAGPFAQRAAEVTADASAKFAEKAHEAAAGLRRDAEAATATAEAKAADEPVTWPGEGSGSGTDGSEDRPSA